MTMTRGLAKELGASARFVRMGEDPSVQRIYIIVAAERVPELDEAAVRGQAAVSDAAAKEIRGRYQGGGAVVREADGGQHEVPATAGTDRSPANRSTTG